MLYNLIAFTKTEGKYVPLYDWVKSFDTDEDAAEYIMDLTFLLDEMMSDVIVTSPDIPFEVKYEYKLLEPKMD